MYRLLTRVFFFLLLAALASLTAAWQYSKFRRGHGLALLSPDHGDTIILIEFVLMLGIALWVACKEKVD
jgi:hypothetical protein